jgi:amidase
VLATLCDPPASVIPVGLTAEGLPVGVQITGRPGADAAGLAIAAALEPIAGGYRAPPPLV